MEAWRQIALFVCGAVLLAACPKKPATPAAPTPGLKETTAPRQPRTTSLLPPTALGAMEAFARGVQFADTEPRVAIDAFLQAIRQSPKLFVAHYNVGVLYERVGDDNKAETYYQSCLAIAPDYAPALGNLVNLLIRRAEARRAVKVAGDVAARFPARLDLRALKVKALIASNRVSEATAEAKGILREDEKNVSAMLLLASIYYAQGKFELSAHALKQALKVDPENPEVQHRLGHALLAQGEKAKAQEAFQKAVELKRDFPEALNSLAMVLLEAGDAGRALPYLEEAVRMAPNFAQAHLNLGNAYRKAGDLVRAKQSYERALQLQGSQADALYNLALLYLDHPMPDAPDEIKRLEVALGYFGRYRDVRDRLPSSDPAVRYIADARRKLDQLKKAEVRRHERERLKKLKKEMEGQKLPGGK